MKITKERLKQIIVEELQAVMSEENYSMADLDIVNKMRFDNPNLAAKFGTTAGEEIYLGDSQDIEQDLKALEVTYEIEGKGENKIAVIYDVPEDSMEDVRKLF